MIADRTFEDEARNGIYGIQGKTLEWGIKGYFEKINPTTLLVQRIFNERDGGDSNEISLRAM